MRDEPTAEECKEIESFCGSLGFTEDEMAVAMQISYAVADATLTRGFGALAMLVAKGDVGRAHRIREAGMAIALKAAKTFSDTEQAAGR